MKTRFLAVLLLAPLVALHAAEKPAGPERTIGLSLQTRSEDGTPKLACESWLTSETAIIVCDMWDLHHCHNAVKREAEMAPCMNEVIEKARTRGVFIIHAPSGCMKAYEGHPARQRAKTTPRAAPLPAKIDAWCTQFPAEKKAVYPIDQADGGEDDDPADHAAWAKQLAAKGLNPRSPWTRQIDALRIAADEDAISDSGVEIWSLLQARGIRNVILMGVHVNMCVAGRPFGLRQMAKNGKRVVLMRDMTDSMYNPASWPHVDHFGGTALFIEHVEKYICPTITSDQFIGGKPFVFSGAGPKADAVSYIEKVRPFLMQYCSECHNEAKANDEYEVTSYAALMRRGRHGAFVVPGKPDASRLSEVLQGMSKSMPPKESPQPTAEETANIVAWIEAGAKDDSPQPPDADKARDSGSRTTSRQTP